MGKWRDQRMPRIYMEKPQKVIVAPLVKIEEIKCAFIMFIANSPYGLYCHGKEKRKKRKIQIRNSKIQGNRLNFFSFSPIALVCCFRKQSPRRFTKPRLSLESATSSVALLLRRAGRIPGTQPEQVNNSPFPTTLSEINTPSLSALRQHHLSEKIFGNNRLFFHLNDR